MSVCSEDSCDDILKMLVDVYMFLRAYNIELVAL